MGISRTRPASKHVSLIGLIFNRTVDYWRMMVWTTPNTCSRWQHSWSIRAKLESKVPITIEEGSGLLIIKHSRMMAIYQVRISRTTFQCQMKATQELVKVRWIPFSMKEKTLSQDSGNRMRGQIKIRASLTAIPNPINNNTCPRITTGRIVLPKIIIDSIT